MLIVAQACPKSGYQCANMPVPKEKDSAERGEKDWYNRSTMSETHKLILVTNDDGIESPGLWGAAEALRELGEVVVAAPRDQYTGAGRSLPNTTDGLIRQREFRHNGGKFLAYEVGGTPAQVVLHAVLEILPRRPDLVVSGINYGENLGTGITISGTVGAALEAAALGIPALAASLETEAQYHLSHSNDVDFRAAAYFTAYFARQMLRQALPFDVDLLKLDVPSSANVDTPWQMTRLSRLRYFDPVRPQRTSWDVPERVGYQASLNAWESGTDVHAVQIDRQVSLTPLSLDMTSRIDLEQFTKRLRQD